MWLISLVIPPEQCQKMWWAWLSCKCFVAQAIWWRVKASNGKQTSECPLNTISPLGHSLPWLSRNAGRLHPNKWQLPLELLTFAFQSTHPCWKCTPADSPVMSTQQSWLKLILHHWKSMNLSPALVDWLSAFWFNVARKGGSSLFVMGWPIELCFVALFLLLPLQCRTFCSFITQKMAPVIECCFVAWCGDITHHCSLFCLLFALCFGGVCHRVRGIGTLG